MPDSSDGLPGIVITFNVSDCPGDVYIGRKVYFYIVDFQGNISKIVSEIDEINEELFDVRLPQVQTLRYFWDEDECDQFIEYKRNLAYN